MRRANYARAALPGAPVRALGWQTRCMKFAWRWMVLPVGGLAVAVAGLLAALVQREPAVTAQAAPSALDVARVVLLARVHDPRLSVPGVVRWAELTEGDVDLLLNHAARGRFDVVTRVAFERGAANVQASVHLPPNPFGRWLNLRARLVQTAALPTLASLQAGQLPVPAWFGQWLLWQVAQRNGVLHELQLASELLRRVDFQPQRVMLAYAWRSDTTERMLAGLIPADEQQRLRAYSDRLVTLAAAQPVGWTSSLAPFIGPLFALASERTRAGGDAAAENRAALVVLTLYANGRGIETLLPAARAWPRPRPLRLTLAGRDDFPLHWLISAALAAEGTGPLSKAIGVYKEVSDSRGGSGFSFNDMAANRAGTRVGELAVAQPQRLQGLLARGVQESDILPPWADLPEFMPEPEFLRRFGGVGAPAYQALLGEIDRRIDALPVWR